MFLCYAILNAMAVSCSRAGRPCFVADFDASRDRLLAFWEQFYSICSVFAYRDIVAVSRAYGISTNAVERWKYGINFPKKDRAEEVIEWVAQGKPMKQMRPFPETPMLR
jgi:hypothetical protein